jgi:hypothetical protein
VPIIPGAQEAEVGGSWFEASLGKFNTIPYLKNKLVDWGIAQVVECLPSKLEAQSSITTSVIN